MTAPTLTPADRELLATLPLTVAALVAEGSIPIAAIRDVRAAAVREALAGMFALAVHDSFWTGDFYVVGIDQLAEIVAHTAALRGAVDAAGGDGGAR